MNITTELTTDPVQQAATSLCCDLDQRLVSVTGQAGTGKTTILRMVHEALVDHGYRVALAAPTGKAAKRIRELTGLPAVTLHRLLEYNHPGEPDPETGKPTMGSFPKRHAENPLCEDVVIVDEYSMVNRAMHRNLIDAIGKGVIRCFGDANQLPPIEEDRHVTGPTPFQRLLKEFASVKLETIYRQGEGSVIVSNGAKILKGRQVTPDPATFVLKLDDKPITMLAKILENLQKKGNSLFDGQTHQVITPQRVGKFGTLVLNKLMSQMYWAGGDSVEIEYWPWELKKDKTMERFKTIGVGQKVIMTKNIYDLRPLMEDRFEGQKEDGAWYGFHHPAPHEEIFNGEAGIVVSVDGGCVGIDLGDRIVSVPPVLEYPGERGDVLSTDPRRWLELGYAITTHKAQGSEYDGVIYFLSKAAGTNQCRANYYTAVTRARKQVVVVGDRSSVSGFSLREKSGW